MITEDLLRAVIEDNYQRLRQQKTIPREKELPRNSKFVMVITGIRRCGKSTLLRQSLKREKKVVFVNFEDNRLAGFELVDFAKIEKIAVTGGCKHLVFDEVQMIEGWEKYVRAAHDKGFNVFVTGSNAFMLSRELGTKLTGRHLQKELFPFSYNEFLLFTGEKAGVKSFKNYLAMGGFPEYLISKDPEYLRGLFRDIIIRDIAVRRNIRNEHVLLRLAMQLISNAGKEISFNSLSKILEIKSTRTTIDYCDFLKESYLLDFIPRFSFSIKQQQVNPRKVYSVDTAMASANSLSFSQDYGRMLENVVFIRLRQLGHEIMYYNDGKMECDFLLKKNEKIIMALQVCWKLTEENLQREVNGLKAALAATGATKGMLLTLDQEEMFDELPAVPVWKWLSE